MAIRCNCGGVIVEPGFEECAGCEQARIEQLEASLEMDGGDYAESTGGGAGAEKLRHVLSWLHGKYADAVWTPDTTVLEALVAAEEIVQDALGGMLDADPEAQYA